MKTRLIVCASVAVLVAVTAIPKPNDCDDVLSTAVNTVQKPSGLVAKHATPLRRPLTPRKTVAEWREQIARQHQITTGSPAN
jgi:hypothetical protein